MLKEKHYALLGNLVRRYMGVDKDSPLRNTDVGQAVVEFYKLVELEAERDARDEANGKG